VSIRFHDADLATTISSRPLPHRSPSWRNGIEQFSSSGCSVQSAECRAWLEPAQPVASDSVDSGIPSGGRSQLPVAVEIAHGYRVVM